MAVLLIYVGLFPVNGVLLATALVMHAYLLMQLMRGIELGTVAEGLQNEQKLYQCFFNKFLETQAL
jgi:hypothetical protein